MSEQRTTQPETKHTSSRRAASMVSDTATGKEAHLFP